jgi:hypothetical protein
MRGDPEVRFPPGRGCQELHHEKRYAGLIGYFLLFQ